MEVVDLTILGEDDFLRFDLLNLIKGGKKGSEVKEVGRVL